MRYEPPIIYTIKSTYEDFIISTNDNRVDEQDRYFKTCWKHPMTLFSMMGTITEVYNNRPQHYAVLFEVDD